MLSMRFQSRQLVASFIISGGARRCQGQYHRQFFRRVCTRQRRKISVSTVFGMWWFPMAFLPLFRRVCLSGCRRKSRRIRKPPARHNLPLRFCVLFLGYNWPFFPGHVPKRGTRKGSGCTILHFSYQRPGCFFTGTPLRFPVKWVIIWAAPYKKIPYFFFWV